MTAYSATAQDSISHLERAANAKGYSFLTAVAAVIFTIAAARDDAHRTPAAVFSIATVGLSIYSWVEFKRAGRQQTKADNAASK